MDDENEQSEIRRRPNANGKARESEAEAVPISVIGPNITIKARWTAA